MLAVSTPMQVFYDPDVDLFYIVDASGSTENKFSPSEMDEAYPKITRKFRKYLAEDIYANPGRKENPREKKGRPVVKATKKRVSNVRSLVSKALK